MSATDDPRITDEEALLRRVVINNATASWDGNLRRWLPSTGGFKIDPDGVSVYRAHVLSVAGFGPADVTGTKKTAAVFEVAVHQVRAESLGVVGDPQPAPDRLGAAHALITFPVEGPAAKKRRLRRLLGQARIVHGFELWPCDGPR